MAEDSNVSRPKLTGNTAVSLGLTIALVGGVVAFVARVPTSSDIKVIVHEAINPIEEKLNTVLVEQARLRSLEDRVRRLEESTRTGG